MTYNTTHYDARTYFKETLFQQSEGFNSAEARQYKGFSLDFESQTWEVYIFFLVPFIVRRSGKTHARFIKQTSVGAIEGESLSQFALLVNKRFKLPKGRERKAHHRR